ncbi:uncharacterized protein LOC132723342 [Ruditapes philippinarum]|uniref:uncharacterized protein LOC132723342 n=1 Tax=Ruditapes philippinarum TaxID=129788 RepID=UPI00295B70C3|nr:uncharacterized protein LOC132723342 [Ruditapes philippinarum]
MWLAFQGLLEVGCSLGRLRLVHIRMSKYAIFGDSFITRLQASTYGKLDFDRPHRFFGVSGMSTQRKFTSKFREMLEYRPRYVFINLGGNDITAACDIHSIYINLINIAEDLYNSGVERVFVASIIERGNFKQWTGLNSKMFNKIRRSLNNKLKKYLVMILCKWERDYSILDTMIEI